MRNRLDKKAALILVLSCAFCLAAGLALGYGIQTQELTGTAISLPPIPTGISSLNEFISLEIAARQIYQDTQDSLSEKMRDLMNSITQANKLAQEDGQFTQAEQAEISQLMLQLQAVYNRSNEISAYFTNYLAQLLRMKDSLRNGGL